MSSIITVISFSFCLFFSENWSSTLSKIPSDNSFVFLVAQNANVIKLVCAASDVLVAKGLDCGKVIKECANILGGNGGGRKNFAEGSGKDDTKMQDALNKAKEIIEKI